MVAREGWTYDPESIITIVDADTATDATFEVLADCEAVKGLQCTVDQLPDGRYEVAVTYA